jgi:hypothetical protein
MLTNKQKKEILEYRDKSVGVSLEDMLEEMLKVKPRKEYASISASKREEIKVACGTNAELAKQFNVSVSTVRNIKLGKPGRVIGSSNGHAKLTIRQVKTIRASSDRGVDLAKKYGVSPANISNIRAGRHWSWI